MTGAGAGGFWTGAATVASFFFGTNAAESILKAVLALLMPMA